MKNVMVRLEEYRRQASTAEVSALEYIITNPDRVIKMSVHELAAASFSSPSTIVRLCKKIGFEGYKDFRSNLTYQIAASERERGGICTSEDNSQSLSAIIEAITFRNIASLQDSANILEEESLSIALDIINKCNRIILFGIGASQLVAQDAYLKFLRIGKLCDCCSDIHSQLLLAKNAGPSDAAIVVSYSGYTDEILACAKELYANKTPIIAITRFQNSALSRLASSCLYVVATEEMYRKGAMSSRISQLNIIDILYTCYVNQNYDENIRKLGNNQILKVQKKQDD